MRGVRVVRAVVALAIVALHMVTFAVMTPAVSRGGTRRRRSLRALLRGGGDGEKSCKNKSCDGANHVRSP